ncbi:MAG: NADP-dependent succinic semialdehyde dehydrogenase [Myxococcales bacterium]|nr:NADP-dependent succinic semialdehyde dehydrogenase [Myxococcales bacterium]
MAFVAINPSNGQEIRRHPYLSPEALEAGLTALNSQQSQWALEPMASRAERLLKLAAQLEAGAPALAQLMAEEMGKPLTEGQGEANKCAWVCRYYAEHAAQFLATETREAGVQWSGVRYEPLGLILAIMPWNFPFWQVFRFAAPAWMAGNGVVMKHAPNVPGCAEAIARLAQEAGLPLHNAVVPVDQVESLIADPRIAAVTLTGSTGAGRVVAAQAGAHIKKTVLELGGSDPFIVLADADLEAAAQEAAASRLLNGGQSCIAAKRIIVEAAVAEPFLAHLKTALGQAVVGDPTALETTVGPMARADLRDALHRQVQASLQAGAKVAMGGTLPGGPGFFYPVTLLTDVGPGMPAWDEELFGPVATLHVAADREAAIAAANDSAYGLGASLWSADTERAQCTAARLQVGNVFINGMTRSDPRLPFGGRGLSGYGRELSAEGIREFVNAKTVWVA